MSEGLGVALAVVAALGSSVVAGFFFAFSVCVMRALRLANWTVWSHVRTAASFAAAALFIAAVCRQA